MLVVFQCLFIIPLPEARLSQQFKYLKILLDIYHFTEITECDFELLDLQLQTT
jgi:hypothetical protein